MVPRTSMKDTMEKIIKSCFLHVIYMSYFQPFARVLTYKNSENNLLLCFTLFYF